MKIGITERGDAGIDLSWADKLDTVDGAILITKNITVDFTDAVLAHKDKVIIHATVTGFGGSVLEPNVPALIPEFNAVMALVKAGFPQNRIVIRVDPIIPTEKGLHTALKVIESFMDMHFNRFRVSVIDMYPHVRARFKAAGLPLPYGDGFAPSKAHLASVDETLMAAKAYWTKEVSADYGQLHIEACAEPGLKEAEQLGCISARDLELLGLDSAQAKAGGYQRNGCLCCSAKTELLGSKHRCPHRCLYCYWKD